MTLSTRFLRNRYILPLLATLLPLPALAFNALRGNVKNSGIYSVDYATLRAAGFSNPEKVGARGLEGSIPVLHRDGRIIMWLQGVDHFSFQSTGYFENKGLDIYHNELSFILTDNPRFFTPIEEADITADGTLVEKGVIFTSYENDLAHNSTNTGNLFWGEYLSKLGASFSWTIDLPASLPTTSARLTATIYSLTKGGGTLRLGNGTGDMTSFVVQDQYTPIALRPADYTAQIDVAGGKNTVAVKFDNLGSFTDTVYLDYWTLSVPVTLTPSYFASLPTTSEESIFTSSSFSGLTGVEALRNLQQGYISTGSDDVAAFDVTSGTPLFRPSHNGKIALTGNGRPFTLAFCNLSGPLRAPYLEGACVEENFLDDATLTEPADMLIISPRWLAEKSRTIADIHREHDGMSVTTVILDDIYNHFSAGNASIEAVREMVKSVKAASDGRLRNVLFVGPATSEIRSANPETVFIAPQAANISTSRGAFFTLERYIIETDTDKDDAINKSEMDMGLGMLPFESEQEADRYIAKLREYITNPFSLPSLESILWMSGEGDVHLHETQTQALADSVNDCNGRRTLHSMLPIDAYGYQQARKRMFDYLDDGKNFTIYIGHASEVMFGKINNTFLNPGHLLTLHNNPLTFFMTAGCSSTKTDSRLRGLAEHMILTSESGAIGGMLTTRETWSSQNKNFIDTFFELMYGVRESALLKGNEIPTIGEAYAAVRTATKDANELAYLLVCDPAIKIPVARHGMGWKLAKDLKIDEEVKIEGEILSNEGKRVEGFNGRAMVRMLAPSVTLRSRNLTSHDPDTIGSGMTMTYDDRVIAMRETDVTDGRFRFSFPLPEAALNYATEGVRFFFTALDDNTLIGAGDYSTVMKIDTERSEPASPKRKANITALGYNPLTGSLSIDIDYDARKHFAIEGEPEIYLDGAVYRYSAGLTRVMGDNGDGITYFAGLPALSEGNHLVEVNLRDVEGNLLSIAETISNDPATPLSLSAGDIAVRDEVSFSYDAPAEGTTHLVVENASGLPVCRLLSEGTSMLWDRTDNAGQRVPAGIYRCYLRHASAEGTLSFSAPVMLTVL